MNMAGRILIADGVATNRITMKVRLVSACYEVAATGSGREALALMGGTRPQVVLVGACLPDMTPAELCAAIRAAAGPDLPVIVQARGPARIEALRAGASALVEGTGDELTLLARIRGLMRAGPQPEAEPAPGLAEPATPFLADPRPRAMFVADQPLTAMGWRHALQGRLDFSIALGDPERALAEAARGRVPDLYLIAADIEQPGDGLRLLSELRSRPLSRDAAFVIVLRPERADLTAVALDLGAGDVLPADLAAPPVATEAAIRLEAQLARKREADQRRAETRRSVLWAMTDPLTGLYNRRYALPRLAEMLASARGRGAPLAVAVIDLDRFKLVNDRHGHAAGDAVLVAVSARLAAAVPPGALVARIGGEEFLAVLPDCDARAARLAGERMRHAVMESPVPVPGSEAGLGVTISAGVAVIEAPEWPQWLAGQHAAGPDPGPDRLLARADQALLSAKSVGRNRIVMARTPLAA